ncbi:hypothetical protein SDJN02_12007, partial [Cucurbita argyrosperma subsp. argyrosperma]
MPSPSPNHLHLQVNGRHSEWRRETKDHEACRSRNNEMPGLQALPCPSTKPCSSACPAEYPNS